MVALKVLPFCHKGGKDRMSLGGQGGLAKGVENSPHLGSKARDEAAAMVGVSGRSVSEAKRVAFFIRHGAKNINR